MIIVLREL